MVRRTFWIDAIERAWRQRSIVWLSGVRRVGKTFLCQSLTDIEYFDCELPRTRRRMESDPQAFLDSMRGRRVVLDEVHRLANPSEILKIAADHYNDVRIVATGSSSLTASARFRDSLTGRKTEVRLTPLMSVDLGDFAITDIPRRLLHGGLPPFFLAPTPVEHDFQEWVDSYWARDIQELFRLERRHSFQRFLEMLLLDSGGIFEATRFASPCDLSRSSVSNYLAVMEATATVTVVRPFFKSASAEIVSAPRVYGFDTGFVCFAKGWRSLRPEDLGLLWEHLVLNELQAHASALEVRYWRDKRGHEVDFVLAGRRSPPVAIECKWSASALNTRNLRRFRERYPEGENWLLAHDVDAPYTTRYDDLTMHVMGLGSLGARLRA